VWIISGLRSRHKNDTALAQGLFFHEHGSSSKALGFHELSFFMAPALASVHFHTLYFNSLSVPQVERQMHSIKYTSLREHTKPLSNLIW